MRPHRNTGARFERHNGETWQHGATHVPTPRELKMRRHKLVPVALFDAPDAVDVTVSSLDEAADGYDPEVDLPDGYTATHDAGGYYVLTDPDGATVEGPSAGKWQGRDGAVRGAWAHLRGADGGTDD